MDSAPELWLTAPSSRRCRRRCGRWPGRTSARRRGWRRSTTPPTIPARPVAAPAVPAGGVGRREQRLEPRVGAVGDLGRVAPGRQPAVVRSARGQQPRVEGERVAAAPRRRGPGRRARSRRRPARPGHLRAPGVPERAGQGPRADRAERPGGRRRRASSAMPSAQPGQRPCARLGRSRPASTYAERPSTASARGVGTVGDQPGRGRLAVDVEVLAVLVEHLPVHRVDRQLQPVAEERRERGVGRPRRRRSPHRAPRWCGPASRTRRCRTGRAAPPVRRWGSACRRAASTAPRCRRSARSRSAGRSGRAASRRPRPGCPATRWPASAAGRRPRRGVTSSALNAPWPQVSVAAS